MSNTVSLGAPLSYSAVLKKWNCGEKIVTASLPTRSCSCSHWH